MKSIFSFIVFAFFSCSLLAQKAYEPYSCYHAKQLLGTKSTHAQQDNRGDFIDILNYRIVLDISDFTSKELRGYTEISFRAKEDVNHIDLDLLNLNVSAVTIYDTVALAFTHNDTVVSIDASFTWQANNSYKIKVFYDGAPIQTPGDWGGFFWNNTYAFNIGVSFTEEIHNFGKAWFPCFDNFTERSTFNFEITTQGNHKAFCNGILNSEIDNIDGTKTWYWALNEAIPTYLANVAVADYATINQVYNKLQGGQVPIQLAALASDTSALKASFVHLNDALLSYETRFGPYRFSRVGYAVTSFNAGAMEHATNITYMSAAVTGNTDWETLMAHELSHHWFGNNTTCHTAEDMWLNEGWASFAEAIFTESVYGEQAYKDYSREEHDQVLRMGHIRDGEYLPVSGVSSEHTYSTTVYKKGADMAHTLRGLLGDDLFFDAMKSFQEDYAFNTITTELLNTHLSNASSLNLTSFFNTWVKEKGFHHFEISSIEVENQDGNFVIQGSIKQKLWETDQYTDFLPIPITFYDANWQKHQKSIFVYGECSDFQFSLDFEPIFWALDLEEKIQDATVDKYEIINNTGIVDFGLARVGFDIQSLSDSALLRVVHHYIKPDPMQTSIANLHLSPNRYWSISGISPSDFEASANFRFNATTSNTDGYLDNDFITTDETNLVMLYRSDVQSDWTILEDALLNTEGNATNGSGYFTINNVQKGDYVMAIYDSIKVQDSSEKTECIYTSIVNVNRLDRLINIFPVPVKKFVNIDFLAPDTGIENIQIFNILGKEIKKIYVQKNKKTIQVETKDWAKGTYIVNFLDTENQSLMSKKISVE